MVLDHQKLKSWWSSKLSEDLFKDWVWSAENAAGQASAKNHPHNVCIINLKLRSPTGTRIMVICKNLTVRCKLRTSLSVEILPYNKTSMQASWYTRSLNQDPSVSVWRTHLLCSLCHSGQKPVREHPNSTGRHRCSLELINYCIWTCRSKEFWIPQRHGRSKFL